MAKENRALTDRSRSSDSPSRSWLICPYCGGDDGRFIVNLRNLFRLAGNLLARLNYYAPDVAEMPQPSRGSPFPLLRHCQHCGERFWGKPSNHADPICDNCGYDLTGNVTGLCSECGWKIPPGVQAKIQSTPTKQHEMRDHRPGGGQPA